MQSRMLHMSETKFWILVFKQNYQHIMKCVPEVDASHDNVEDDLSCIDDEKKDDEKWNQHQSSVT